MKALQEKLRQVEDDHAEEIETNNLSKHDNAKYSRALVLLGGIRAVNRVSQNLDSQVMTALINFQSEAMHEQLGFTRFADFLDNSEYSPMKKSEFYRRKELFDSEGAELYDAFNAIKIPTSTRKLLAKRGEIDIAIEGNELVIGEERADLSDMPTVKQILNDLAKDNKSLYENSKKLDDKVEKLNKQIQTGTAEVRELQRTLDAQNDGTPYERALTKTIGALINLTLEARKLPLVESQNRGRGDIEALWKQMLLVRHALYQEDFVFIEELSANTNGISKEAMQLLAKDDDFGDDKEG